MRCPGSLKVGSPECVSTVRDARLRMAAQDRLDLAHQLRPRHLQRQADVDFQPAMAGQHVDLEAALDHAGRDGDAVEDVAGSLTERRVHRCRAKPRPPRAPSPTGSAAGLQAHRGRATGSLAMRIAFWLR